MNIKTWKPKDGCKSCNNAKRIMNDQLSFQNQHHAKCLKKILKMQEEIDNLKCGVLNELKAEKNDIELSEKAFNKASEKLGW